MYIEHLELLCSIAHTRSLSDAGKAFNISQSAVSQILRQVEKRLGASLFDRRKRPLVLTEEGRMFIAGLQPLLHRYKALEEEISSKHEDVRGEVRIAAIYSAGHLRLGHVLQEFSRQNPKAKVQLSYLHPDQIYHQVLVDEVDIGILSCPERRKGLSITPWVEQEMALVCPSSGALSEIERCARRELHQKPFVAFSKDLAIRRFIDLYLRSLEIKIRVACEFDNIDTMKCAVEEQLGVSILPVDCITRERSLGTVKVIPLGKTPLWRPLGIVQRSNAPTLRVKTAMLQLLQRSRESV